MAETTTRPRPSTTGAWSLYFNPMGTVSRGAYWTGVLTSFALPLAVAVEVLAAFNGPRLPTWAFTLELLALPAIAVVQAYALFCLFAKRLRDAGHRGWWALLALAPALVAAVKCGVAAIGYAVAGYAGSSRFTFELLALVLSVWAAVWLVIALPFGLLARREATLGVSSSSAVK
jgi:uncharacterized membrane protein YhaH (DUF805 family)